MILKRVTPKLWVGREYFEGGVSTTIVLAHHFVQGPDGPEELPNGWRASLAIITKGDDPSKAPLHKSEGKIHEILAWAQQTIATATGFTVPIVKQEVPWETIIAESNESAAVD